MDFIYVTFTTRTMKSDEWEIFLTFKLPWTDFKHTQIIGLNLISYEWVTDYKSKISRELLVVDS